jgi:hypothetical protein
MLEKEVHNLLGLEFWPASTKAGFHRRFRGIYYPYLQSKPVKHFHFKWFLQPLQGPGLFFSSVIIFYADGRTTWTSRKLVARPLPIHRTTQTQNKRIPNNHASSGIRTHDLTVRASEDSSCLRPRGRCNRHMPVKQPGRNSNEGVCLLGYNAV